MREALLGTLVLLLIACAGGDLPAPSAPTDPANPKAVITPFEMGANPLTTNLSAPPATTTSSSASSSSSSHRAAPPPSMKR